MPGPRRSSTDAGSASIRRPRSRRRASSAGSCGAVPAGDPVPLFARLDGGWLKDLQLTLDAINHQWRRNVVELQLAIASARCGANGGRPVRAMADRARRSRCIAAWAIALLAWLAAAAQAQGTRAGAVGRASCRRLARARPAAHAARRTARICRAGAARWPQFAIAFRAIGESFAMLRYGDMAQARERARGAAGDPRARDRGAAARGEASRHDVKASNGQRSVAASRAFAIGEPATESLPEGLSNLASPPHGGARCMAPVAASVGSSRRTT